MNTRDAKRNRIDALPRKQQSPESRDAQNLSRRSLHGPCGRYHLIILQYCVHICRCLGAPAPGELSRSGTGWEVPASGMQWLGCHVEILFPMHMSSSFHNICKSHLERSSRQNKGPYCADRGAPILQQWPGAHIPLVWAKTKRGRVSTVQRCKGHRYMRKPHDSLAGTAERA